MPPTSDAKRAQRYITTPIYYVNDVPHIGHVYTSTLCDVWARFMRFAGHDVFFLTGTDEHGVKVEKSARERNLSPQQLADLNAAEFQSVMASFNLTNDDFVRTTFDWHERQVQAFVQRMVDSGDIYLGEFEGWYDEGQEEYYTETKAKDLNYTSPVSRKPLVRAKEHNYYFRLSAYQRTLEDLFAANTSFVRPEARRNEVLGRLREGLQDVPVSRTNFSWGVSMPNDPRHVIYVWIDALFNYVTALGLARGSEDHRFEGREKYWPATYHVVGKEILWFHAVIWPAMLMALKLPLPRCIYAHSFWISEGQKMSKSLGNFIDLKAIQHYVSRYGLDAWRYYLVTQGPLGAQDANFSAAHFHDVYHTDLVNTVGNCASRVTAMIGKYFDGLVPAEAESRAAAVLPTARCSSSAGAIGEAMGVGESVGGAVAGADDDIAEAGPDQSRDAASPVMLEGFHWPAICRKAIDEATASMESFDLSGAAAAALALVRKIDAFINATEPFKLAKDESKRDALGAILYQCMESVRIASLLLWPVVPAKMHELWNAIELPLDPNAGELRTHARWGVLQPGAKVRKIALFPRVEPVQGG